MAHPFQRTGALKELSSYPLWLQRIVRETAPDKSRVVDHEKRQPAIGISEKQ